MLSKSSKYAIRAVLFLTLHSSEEKKFSPKQVAEEIDVPAPFLAKTLQKLSKHNIISSTKGRNGGFYLTTANKTAPLLDVIICVDGLGSLKSCFLGLPNCSDHKPCSIHASIAPFRKKLLNKLANKSLKEYAEDVREKKAYLTLV